MKSVMSCVFGSSLGVMISVISPYTITNWQWWAALLPVMVIGVIYANVPPRK
ncbi:MAG: hypothetical protein HYW79_03475 [Parcubacteria group bacterium]|nr:hypothetical protein [Parcubacteria group bacterium]